MLLSTVWHSSNIQTGWSFHVKPATLLEMSLSAEVMKHLITPLLHLVMRCFIDHLKYIYCSYCTRNEKLSFFKWRQRLCQSSRLWRLCGLCEWNKAAPPECGAATSVSSDIARVSQRLTNTFKQPWLWRTSLSGRRWAELMSWMSSSP